MSSLIIIVAILMGCNADPGRAPIISKDISIDKEGNTTLDLKRVGFVNDYVNILDIEARDRLETRLRKLKEGADVEFVIVIVDSLKGQTLESYSNNLIRLWNMDPANENDKKFSSLLI